MKKIMLLLLVGTLLLGLVACAASKQADETEAKPAAEPEPEETPENEPITGGWSAAASVELTDEVRALLDKALEDYTGLNVVPVAYLGSQVVAGTNHALLCRIAPVTPDAVETWAIVYLYEDLEGRVEITEVKDFGRSTELSTGSESGGWGLPTTPELTDADRAAFETALEGFTGVACEPVALLSLQVVGGFNKCFLCRATPVYPDAQSTWALVYVYEDLEGGAEITEIADLPEEEPVNVQIPNPFVDYATLEEAVAAVGFDFRVPETVDGYPAKVIQVMDGELIQVIYLNGDERLFVRKAAGSDDISGDYNVYSEAQTVTIGGCEVSFEGENGEICLAKWTQGGYTYAVMPDVPMSAAAMTDLISQIS